MVQVAWIELEQIQWCHRPYRWHGCVLLGKVTFLIAMGVFALACCTGIDLRALKRQQGGFRGSVPAWSLVKSQLDYAKWQVCLDWEVWIREKKLRSWRTTVSRVTTQTLTLSWYIPNTRRETMSPRWPQPYSSSRKSWLILQTAGNLKELRRSINTSRWTISSYLACFGQTTVYMEWWYLEDTVHVFISLTEVSHSSI